MKRFIKIANILMILSIFVIIFLVAVGMNKKEDTVKSGMVDVSNISSGKTPVYLTGKWEFYWGQLISSYGKIPNTKNKQMVEVPANWTKYKDNDNKKLPVDGYAVYRILVKGSKGSNLALKIPQIASSYNLWIDGKIRYSSGQVGKNSDESKSEWTTKVINFTVQNEYTEIIFEVSNFHYFRSGITTPIIIGTEAQIQQLKYRGLFMDSFIFAALLIMAVFFLLLYILHTVNRAYIYLALYSIAIAIRPLLYGECYFNNIFPNINFEINSKIYLVNFISIQLFFLYFYCQYKDILSKKILYIIGYSLIFIISIGIILPARYMIYPVILLEIMIPIVVLICIYLLCLAYKKKYEYVGVNVLSVLLLFFLSIIDVLNNSKIIQLNIYYTPMAILIVTFIQAFLQICKFRESTLLNERLIHEVEIKNLRIGYEVRQRNIAEKFNSALKDMVSTLEIEDLIVCIIDNLYQIIKFDNAIVTFNLDKKMNFIANKLNDCKVKCMKYEGEINNLFYKEAESVQVQIKKLYTIGNIEKSIIVKPLYYEGKLFCSIKIIVNTSRENISKDLIQLLDVYSEEVILALQNAKSYKKIKELAMYDELTKLYTRRYLMKLGMEQFEISKEFNSDYAVVMLDIDYFKRINDNYGHLFGDEIIRNIAYICKKCMPVNSIVGRYGGEEFVIFLKNIKFNVILKLLEVLRCEVENYKYYYNNHIIKVTISIGVAIKQNQNENLYNIISNADKALYRAKNSGRNCIKVFDDVSRAEE